MNALAPQALAPGDSRRARGRATFVVEVRVKSHAKAAGICMFLRHRLRNLGADVRIVKPGYDQ